METILVVDDEPSLRNMLIRSISAGGYTVLEAASGREAVQLVRSFAEPIHLAIIDHTLEDRNGADVAAEIARIRPGVRVLLISGKLEHDVLPSSVPCTTALSFLQKPFMTRALLDRIRTILSDRSNRAGM